MNAPQKFAAIAASVLVILGLVLGLTPFSAGRAGTVDCQGVLFGGANEVDDGTVSQARRLKLQSDLHSEFCGRGGRGRMTVVVALLAVGVLGGGLSLVMLRDPRSARGSAAPAGSQ